MKLRKSLRQHACLAWILLIKKKKKSPVSETRVKFYFSPRDGISGSSEKFLQAVPARGGAGKCRSFAAKGRYLGTSKDTAN